MLETSPAIRTSAPILPRFMRPPETSVSLVHHFEMDGPKSDRPFGRGLSHKAACEDITVQLTSLLAMFHCQYAFGDVHIHTCAWPRVSGTHTLQHVPFAGQSAEHVMQNMEQTARAFEDILAQQGWIVDSSYCIRHMPTA